MDRPTDLAAVALNITPFDFVGNRKKVEKTLDEIKAAFPQNRRPLVLFPERTFSGHCGSFHDALFVRTAAREQLDAVLAKTAGMIALSSTTHSPPRTLTASQGRALGAGPRSTLPSAANCEPWHGHSNPLWPGLTMHPKCVQTRETA